MTSAGERVVLPRDEFSARLHPFRRDERHACCKSCCGLLLYDVSLCDTIRQPRHSSTEKHRKEAA
jgi:hypothetical protein